MTEHRRSIRALAVAAALAIPAAGAADPTLDPAVYSADRDPASAALAAYRAMSAGQSRNYDRTQDISPRQMAILLEVAERTGTSLGQALATGEHESAHTWNDHVRPTLRSGNLGSATGVWQFQPATFHRILKRYGTRLLAASAADPATARAPLDLAEGPFDDAQVRALIGDAVAGRRGADDEALQLLRHNFAVLAFAKHYLSIDSGATSPEEDYLYHFLGAGQGKRVLALARGEARDTLCVKPAAPPAPPQTQPDPLLADRRGTGATAEANRRLLLPPGPQPAFAYRYEPRPLLSPPPLSSRWGAEPGGEPRSAPLLLPPLDAEPEVVSSLVSPLYPDPPPVSSQWGLPADSPTVTGNLGMFYRDGKGQTQPYTWGEFMQNLARRVRAEGQPALVRAKYGVGFPLNGGDMPGREFDPERLSAIAEFRHTDGQPVAVPEAMALGTLNPDETEYYKERLAALVSQGDDAPLATLPPESLAALYRLKLLPAALPAGGAAAEKVRQALHGFRKLVGKDAPDHPAQAGMLLPSERVALEVYDRRIVRYGALQACQRAASGQAPDLARIGKLPAGSKRRAAPYIAAVQQALAGQGLLAQPTKKSVWRDKRRKKHVTYKKVPFAGKPDKATIAALATFQVRHGLRDTKGVLDGVTLNMLGLPAMGPEIFLPLSGPYCAIHDPAASTPRCGTASPAGATLLAELVPPPYRSVPERRMRTGAYPAHPGLAPPPAEAPATGGPGPAGQSSDRQPSAQGTSVVATGGTTEPTAP